jgi:hypothetical protein
MVGLGEVNLCGFLAAVLNRGLGAVEVNDLKFLSSAVLVVRACPKAAIAHRHFNRLRLINGFSEFQWVSQMNIAVWSFEREMMAIEFNHLVVLPSF